ncbi:sensor histidine kinase RegB [Falsihalocynthiibacter sp. SS001]|uniref:sensor histidine kinase RegB n=1 Tax=Falsihalocynthiibacter sp. SS001 TaxID=3349698 RepID=UPI0036D2FFE6
MTEPQSLAIHQSARSDWIRLRTLIVLRWVAIFGQILAIFVARQYYDIQLDLGLCYLAISASVMANFIAMFVYPENKRLSESQAVLMLLFDISQLMFLLYLTGGLHNPFALLILVPVTISATVLTLQSTLLLGAVALALTTLLAIVGIPLHDGQGHVYALDPILLFGFWLSIVIGTVFLALYARRVTNEIHSMSEALLATQMALAREQKLTDLGGVVAAAAHELGTPLATIKLAAAEMVDELEDGSDLKEDAILIGTQADRCREILRSMGRAGKDDLHMHTAPFEAVVREAAEPHLDRGPTIHFHVGPSPSGAREHPEIYRRPEVIHGLRNLVQNAVDFSNGNVWIDLAWTADRIQFRIVDDGAGFPPHLIGRIGEPFVRKRMAGEKQRRPGYEGMGLGLFIAKTLLERSGAELSFANGADPFLAAAERPQKCGAVVEVVWPLDVLTVHDDNRGSLGENPTYTV